MYPKNPSGYKRYATAVAAAIVALVVVVVVVYQTVSIFMIVGWGYLGPLTRIYICIYTYVLRGKT